MATRVYKLHMTAPLHIGDKGVGIEETHAYIPSDSLFSALVVTWNQMRDHAHVVQILGDDFATDPPLLLTSVFPFAGESYLLPKPILPVLPHDRADKQFKRVRWVSLEIFRRLCRGISSAEMGKLWEKRALVQGGSVWLTQAEWDALADMLLQADDGGLSLWGELRVPKVTVDRVHNASTLFHEGRAHFAEGCGLWFTAQGDDAWLARTQAALALLADSGIGGRRSRGNGQFRLDDASDPPDLTATEPDSGPDTIADTTAGAYCVLLSRLAPTEGQMGLLRQPEASYQLVTVGGWNGTPGDSPLIRKQVRMLAEGSIIGANPNRADSSNAEDVIIPGKLVNVTPDKVDPGHRIYRYGYGYTVPIHIRRTNDTALSETGASP